MDARQASQDAARNASRDTVRSATIAVIGVGSVGAMVAWQLAKRGVQGAVAIEQFGIGHTHGAYSGESRLFRTVSHEGDHYPPLLLEAQRLWRELEVDTGRKVYLQVGALSIAPHDHPKMVTNQSCVEKFDLPHEFLEHGELSKRFPQHDLDAEDVGLLDLGGGGIRPELSIASAAAFARENGMDVITNTEVFSIEPEHEGYRITTGSGDILASKVVVTAGPWAARLNPELRPLVRVKSLPLTWFMPKHIEMFTPDVFPVFVRDRGDTHLFGAPTLDGYAIKASRTPFADWPFATDVSGAVSAHRQGEISGTSALAKWYLPDLHPEPVRHSVHPDGYTADRVPIIDLSEDGSLVTVAGLSGHGMKFATVFGRIAAELATRGNSELYNPTLTSIPAHQQRALPFQPIATPDFPPPQATLGAD